jgi:hypothetical protein
MLLAHACCQCQFEKEKYILKTLTTQLTCEISSPCDRLSFVFMFKIDFN